MRQLAELLKEKKLKVTPQRLAIFKVLLETKKHPSAETIYNSLQQTHPTMSLATVYKTLDALKKSNLVQELNVGEDCFRYDANVLPHPHVICTNCHRVDDLETDILECLHEKVTSKTDFKLTSEKVYFYGICPDCQKEKE